MKKMNPAKMAMQRAGITRAPLPPQAPRKLAPGGDRPLGVAPAPMPNPMPMSAGEAQSRARTQAMRGGLPGGAVGIPAATQPGFRPGPSPTAMAEGGKVKAKSKTKAKRK